MRKVSSILLIFVYLVTLTGMSLSVHHCQGKTAYGFLGLTINKTCKCVHTDVKHSSKCCNNEKIVIEKNNTDKFSPKESIELKLVCSEFTPSQYNGFNFLLFDNTLDFIPFKLKAPPDISSDPLYLINRAILI